MKRGTCENCGRPDIGIVSGGKCKVCYGAQKGLTGEEKEKALAEARERIQGGKLRSRKTEKRETCSNCERPGIKPGSTGLCNVCYRAQKGLEGEEREKALAEIKRKIQNGEIRLLGRGGRKRKDPDKKPSGAKPRRQEPLDEEPEIKISTIERIVLGFGGPDLDIYEALKQAAGDSRRDVGTPDALYVSMQAEAMCILERALQDRIWCTREQHVTRREQPE